MPQSLKVKLLEAQLRMKEWESVYGRTEAFYKNFEDFNVLVEKVRFEQSTRKTMDF